ncbi:MAG: ISNCY family transposase [Nitrosopumilus sp.]|nr:ISNCY family transposase [Nitrosopumilus sp.]
MNEQELTRWRIIEEVLSKRLTQKEAAVTLDLGERQLRNLLTSYKEKGKQGLISKHRGKKSNNKYDEPYKCKILRILTERYSGYGPTLSSEKLYENYGISVSKETIRIWMVEKGMWHAKHSRKKIHQRRQRRACFGELVQGDGSHHIWLEISGIECCLLVFIDDATSRLTSMHLSQEETLEAYFTTLKQHIQRYGCFKSLYLDRSAVAKSRVGSNVTQFERALKTLGIELIIAHSPQAKGRVERANRTLQDRFVKFLRENKIETLEEANKLIDDFIKIYNDKFAVSPNSVIDLHKPLDKYYDIDLELRKIEKRKLTKDLCFSYNNIIYKVKNGLNHLSDSREVEIILLDNEEIRVRCNKQWLVIEKDSEPLRTPREKKIIQLNKKWTENEDLKSKNLTGWQMNNEHKKKAMIVEHAFII